MARLLEHVLYEALRELREAEKALIGARLDYASMTHQLIDYNVADLDKARLRKLEAGERMVAARVAADKLLAVTTNDYEQVAEQFGGDFVMRD